MRRIWMCMVCLLLCLSAGCGQEELYISPLPRNVDGTVMKVDEVNKEIVVEITSPEELWSYDGEKKVDCLLKKGDVILTGYDGSGDFADAPPKTGMYGLIFLMIRLRPERISKRRMGIYILIRILSKKISPL